MKVLYLDLGICSKEEAENLKKSIEAAGAKVELK